MSERSPELRRGTAVGLAIALPVLILNPLAHVGLYGWWSLGTVVVAGFVLVVQRQPFRRGIGVGLLGAVAVAALVIGACANMLRDL